MIRYLSRTKLLGTFKFEVRTKIRQLLFGKLSNVLIWQTLLISVVPLSVIASIALYAASAMSRSFLEDESWYISNTAKSQIESRAAANLAAGSLVAELPTMRTLAREGDGEQLGPLLTEIAHRFNLDVLRVTDPSGSIIAERQNDADDSANPTTRPTAIDQDREGWALLNESEGLVLHAFVPIKGDTGGIVGHVDAGTNLGPAFLRTISGGTDSELAVGADGRVVAATNALSVRQLPLPHEIDSRSGKIVRGLTLDGRRYVATFTTIEGHGETMTLAVLSPLARAEAMTRALWVVTSVLTLCLCLAVIVLTRRVAQGIIAPFRQLVFAAQQIRRGDLSAQVEPKSEHELRILEMAFNTMTEALRKREGEQAAHEAELLHIASHDPLTGLPNRSVLEEALHDAVTKARTGTQSTLLYMDLDQFKIVNDTLGHNSGDRVLAMVADVVGSTLREGDLLARLGGDEFAALLPGLDLENAGKIAERVRNVVDECRFVEGGESFALGLSIGVAAITGSASASEVLGQADMACYTAKSEGRNRIAAYEAGAAAVAVISEDGRWTSELRDALNEGRLRLAFQPVLRLAGECVDHFETLIRLQDKKGRFILPDAFIPSAERSGQIRDIDAWVLKAALERILEQSKFGKTIHLAVNISGVTLGSPDSAKGLRETIKRSGVDPRAVTIEITETALMTNLTRTRTIIDEFRQIGCQFALDDFGTGFSSFAYLAELPIDSVKIHGVFVRDIATNSVNMAIVRAISTVAHSSGKVCTAEWVEDAETLELLKTIGVDFAQGYYIGRPSTHPWALNGEFSTSGSMETRIPSQT
jgi:diguanylate cyclase (GGDEF)-like protein